jgi:hypothetical protein
MVSSGAPQSRVRGIHPVTVCIRIIKGESREVMGAKEHVRAWLTRSLLGGGDIAPRGPRPINVYRNPNRCETTR